MLINVAVNDVWNPSQVDPIEPPFSQTKTLSYRHKQACAALLTITHSIWQVFGLLEVF